LKAGLVAICIVLVALTEVAKGEACVSAECVSATKDASDSSPAQWGYPFVAWATYANADPVVTGVMSRFPLPPERALQFFERASERQAIELRGYTATTLINAELPDMSKRAEFELRRVYVAPKTLEFTPLRFAGDIFVKTNVIARLLQSEVDRLRDPQQFVTAINETNYKISHRDTTQIDDRPVHVYQLKPHQRRVGLFEGRMFLDAFTGSMVRNEGRLVKTPSFVLKKVEFVQDYMDIGGFSLLKHVHSAASTRMIGRTVVESMSITTVSRRFRQL